MNLRRIAAVLGAAALAAGLVAGTASAHPIHLHHPVVSVTGEGSYVVTSSRLRVGEVLFLNPGLTGGGAYVVLSVTAQGPLYRVVLGPALPAIYKGQNANFTAPDLP